MKGKPQRRTIVKALAELSTAVANLNAFGGLESEKSFRPLLRAMQKAQEVLKREAEAAKKEQEPF